MSLSAEQIKEIIMQDLYAANEHIGTLKMALELTREELDEKTSELEEAKLDLVDAKMERNVLIGIASCAVLFCILLVAQ